MALNISVPISLFIFFLFSWIVNPALGFLHRRLALHRRELAAVFIMAMMAAVVPTEGYIEHMIPKIVSGYYYATPENQWTELIHPHMKPWIAPQDPAVVRYFFEGLPAEMPLPWSAWVRPLFFWTIFFLLLCFVMVCAMVILRRQWVDNERLVYPLVQLPLEMIRERGADGAARPFFKQPLMWAGFAIPFTILGINALHSYYNFVPAIVLQSGISLFRNTVGVSFAISFMTLGFSYFVNLQVLAGIWFFFIFVVIHRGIFNVLGIEMHQQLPDYSAPDAITAHEGMGAMIAFVLFILWIARGHLGDVFKKAFTGDPQVDDSQEMLSYRTAVFGMLSGLVALGVCLNMSGLPAWLVPWFLFVVFVLFIGLSRFVAEAGLATIRTPLYPQAFVTSSVGTTHLDIEGLVALGLSYSWVFKLRIFAMVACANALKIESVVEIGGTRRGLFAAIGLTLVVSLVGSTWFLLDQAYTYGGINLNQMFFGRHIEGPYATILMWMNNPSGVNWGGWFYTALGAAFMVLLMLARHYFLWWPLNPIGFPVAITFVGAQIWWSVFLIWVFKNLILKYGGPGIYRGLQPFFLGLILGNVAAGGFWFLVDGITGMQGNILVYF